MTYQFVLIVGGTTWTVPYNWNSNNNRITCIGGGAGGSDWQWTTGYYGGSGGGGGARASSVNVSLTPGATVSITIGGGGAGAAAAHTYGNGTGANGGDTSFNSGQVYAQGGRGGTLSGSAGGAGGAASSSTGNDYKYSGGNGGVTYGSTNYGYYQGGGGGAGGNTGVGGNGTAGPSQGFGGVGGATGGAGYNNPPNVGVIGYDNGSSASVLGYNFSASGGGGAQTGGPYGGYGAFVGYGGWGGALFGSGGGGGGGLGGGNGAQGLIFIEWNPYNVTQSSSVPIPFDPDGSNPSIGMILNRGGQMSLNDSDVRSLAGVSSGQIGASNFFSGKHPTFSIVGASTYNGSGYSAGHSYQPFTSYPSGSQAGDLAVIVSSNYAPSNRTLNGSGSGYTYCIGNIGSYVGMFGYTKLLTSSDSGPMYVYVQTQYTSHMLFTLRNISRFATLHNNTEITSTTTFYTPNPAYSDNGTTRAYLVLTASIYGASYGYSTVTSTGWTTIAQVSDQYYFTYLNAQIIDASNLAPGGAYTISVPSGYNTISSIYELT
jgi:hypothetical protein